MIPDKVIFTGLELDPMSIFNPRHSCRWNIPSTWTGVFTSGPMGLTTDPKFILWMEENTHGGWDAFEYLDISGDIIIYAAFEKDADMMLYRLADLPTIITD